MARLNDKKLIKSQLAIFIVYSIVISTAVLIPLRVIGYGYLPPDDALRHAAKVISGKEWKDILVLREGITMDMHPGWHAILGFIRKITQWDVEYLVVFSVAFFFILFFLTPLLLLRRPESWLIAMLVITVAEPGLMGGFFLGRPYIFLMFVLLVISLLWPQLKGRKTLFRVMIALILLIAASTWIHCSWYLFALPLFCFFLAREWRAGFRIFICIAAGVAIGACLTGHPYLFLKETLLHAIRDFSNHQLQRMLVRELQPFTGDPLMVMAVLGTLAWRCMRGTWDPKRVDNPIFILAVSSWVLGFFSMRFWTDWGIPAVAIWMAQEFQEALEAKVDFFSLRRFLLILAVAGTFYIAVTNDFNGRWTWNLTKGYLSLDGAECKEWLPEPGGIVYSDDMEIFFDTFYKNPRAPWRYILGFEPTMMPPEDLDILRKIQFAFGADETFEPWVKKMKPEDRLIVERHKRMPPQIPGLEWRYVIDRIWIGRLPKDSI